MRASAVQFTPRPHIPGFPVDYSCVDSRPAMTCFNPAMYSSSVPPITRVRGWASSGI
jgi:hypothetical protein